jgi:DNA-directed RNA polymerase subunit RPC12/RpoP
MKLEGLTCQDCSSNMKLEGLNMSELFFKHGTREALACQDCSSNMKLEGLLVYDDFIC